MRSRRLTRGVIAVSAAAAAAGLGHACSDDPAGPDGSLPVVSNLTVEPIATGRMRVNWSNVEGASGYAIERRRDLTGEFEDLTEIDAPNDTAVTYVDTDIEPVTFYGYRVRTLGRVGSFSRASDIAGARSPALPGIEVNVTLDAPDPSTADTDGFLIRLEGAEPASETVTVTAGDTVVVLLSPLAPGNYTVTLDDVADTCTVDDGATRPVTVTNQVTDQAQIVADILLRVRCRDSSKGGIVAEVSVQGDTTDGDGVRVRVVGDTTVGTVLIEENLHPTLGETATTQNADLLDLEPGGYEVLLRDVDASACSLEGDPSDPNRLVRRVDVIAPQNDTVRFTLTCTVNQAPSADAGGPYAGKANTPVQFGAEGSSDPDGSIAGYTWDFGDSSTPGKGETPTHAYEAEDTFTVVLTVTDDRGGTDIDSAVVMVGPPNQPPIARVAGQASGEVGAQLAFNASESSDPDGEITAFAWSFGDGTTDDREIAPKTFTTSGTYKVKVAVTDNDGDTASDSMVVVITDSPNEPPSADAGGPYTGVQGEPVNFDGSRSSDPEGAVVRYDWQFGDGRDGSGKTVLHTYARAGPYAVVLTVFDEQGAIAYDIASVDIEPDPSANQPPIAQANGPYNGTVNKSVLFNAGGSFDPDGQNINGLSYAWDFGDGTEGSRLTTSHVYKEPGNYTVRLTVTDDQDLTGRDSSRVTIAAASNRRPIANAGGRRSGQVDVPIPFSAADSDDPDGDIVHYAWTFGDGDTATGLSVRHAYTGAGTYPVVLTVRDNLGAVDADTIEVEVTSAPSNGPPAAEAGGPYDGMVGTPITLDGSASSDLDGTIASFDWDFNNNGVFDDASGANPEFTCSAEGGFPVALQVTDDDGATDSDATTVECTEEPENLPPIADANGPYDAVVGTPITLDGSASSDPDGAIDSFDWDFDNDGVFDDESGANPEFTCAASGRFLVALQVTDDDGATGSDPTTVECTEEQVGNTGTVRGRWVDANGAPITQTTVGSTIFLEIDIELEGNNTIFTWQAALALDPLLLTATTQGADLNCSNPGGQVTCPSGAPPAGNNDIIDQYAGNNNVPGIPGALVWVNVTTDPSGAGVGIQGLARLEFLAEGAGTVMPELTIVDARGDNGATDIAPGIVWSIPLLVIN